MSQLLEWKVGRALAATNRPKVENVKTSDRLIDQKTQVVCPISIIRALKAVGQVGDNLIRELTGQSDPKCKLSVKVQTHFLIFLWCFTRMRENSVGGTLQPRLAMRYHGSWVD